MKVLALWGKGSKGKTTTLNLLTGLLSNDFTQNIKPNHPIKIPVDKEKDNCYVVTYNGKKIGITTRGDTKEALEKDFEWLKKQYNKEGCDLYVCATRSKGATCEYVEKEAATGDIFWIAKASITHEKNRTYVDSQFIIQQQCTANERQAASMKEFIDSLITQGII